VAFLVDSAVWNKVEVKTMIESKQKFVRKVYKDEANTFVVVHRCSYHLGHSVSRKPTPSTL
jgi:hypothetical protein